MRGPETICRSLARGAIPDRHGNTWQYHSRSDRHSKVACWVVAFELLQECGLLRDHVASGKVVLGVNHTVRDFQTQRTKDLDLVVAQPAASVERPAGQSFSELADRWRVDLSSQERFLSRTRTSTTSGSGSV